MLLLMLQNLLLVLALTLLCKTTSTRMPLLMLRRLLPMLLPLLPMLLLMLQSLLLALTLTRLCNRKLTATMRISQHCRMVFSQRSWPAALVTQLMPTQSMPTRH